MTVFTFHVLALLSFLIYECPRFFSSMNLFYLLICNLYTLSFVKSEDETPALRRRWTQSPQPSRCLHFIPTGKEKTNFLSLSVTGCLKYNLGQAPCPEVAGQPKLVPCFCVFVLLLLSCFFFSLHFGFIYLVFTYQS